jgi:hypothetical protein
MVALQPPIVGRLGVAGECMKEARRNHAVHVGDELDDYGRQPEVVVVESGRLVEQDVDEMTSKEEEADQMGPDVDCLVVNPKPTENWTVF